MPPRSSKRQPNRRCRTNSLTGSRAPQSAVRKDGVASPATLPLAVEDDEGERSPHSASPLKGASKGGSRDSSASGPTRIPSQRRHPKSDLRIDLHLSLAHWRSSVHR